VCRDPARSAEVEESFKDSRKTKLRRNSAFVHRAIAARSVGSRGNPSRFHSPEAQEGKHLQECGRDQGYRVRRETKAKTFDTLEIFQGGGRSESSGGSYSCR
jgi:hypothetical protein